MEQSEKGFFCYLFSFVSVSKLVKISVIQ